MENVNQPNEPQQSTVYSKWNRLLFSSAESNNKKWFNIVKYGIALLITIFSLMALWFTTQWQSTSVLKGIGIDLTKWTNYLVSTDSENMNLINKLSGYSLWNLKGSSLTESGVQWLVAIAIMSLASILPLIIFKNGTIWSVGSIALSSILFLVVVILFSLGIASQANALKNANMLDTSSFNMAEIDKINASIAAHQALLIPNPTSAADLAENNKNNNIILDSIAKKDSLLAAFMPKLKEYLLLF